MFTYQCKCCGAPLDIKPSVKICKCAYCETMQTVPLLDYDEKAVLWERADNLRRSGEYDRATEIYNQLAELDDQEPDVFWSRMLCTYGVEYVEENGSRKRTPTINRIQYTPIIDNEDYHTVLKLADSVQHRLYIVQAMQLEELRKEILSVSMTAEPYDIFICYKENDSSGRRTDDSVLAGQLYRALTAEGWRVFFARISLENKAGTEYEPYIFAALNSAKLMLAVGTSPENFNAVWVRNEWNRYLYRISERNEGSLVVLYKNMLPQHLPEEFAHLQTFDMGEPDFMEELLRGTRKLLSSPKQDTTQTVDDTNVIEGATAASLLRRAELCLEDGEFYRANEFCELALNCEPENAQVYFTKLLAENKIKSEDELPQAIADFSQSGSYKKAMRFGDEEFRERLSEINRQCLYNRYCTEFNNATNETQFEGIARRFAALGDYLDSSTKAEECRERAQQVVKEKETAENERKYIASKIILDEPYANIEILSKAQQQLKELGDYKDSTSLAEKCGEKMKTLTAQREKELAETARIEQRQKKVNKLVKMCVLIGTSAVAVIVGVCILINQINLSSRYNDALALCENGEYDTAITEFTALSNYKDSDVKANHAKYLKAMSLFESKQYAEAGNIFESLGSYEDSKSMLLETQYSLAIEDAENGRYNDAATQFTALGAYSDSRERASLCLYAYAEQLYYNQEFDLAADIYEQLGNFADSSEKAITTKYTAADYYAKNGEYECACELYEELGSYADCSERLLQTQFAYANHLTEIENYKKAIELYSALDKMQFPELAEKLEYANYHYALQLADKGIFENAISILSESKHEKAKESLNEIYYRYATILYDSGDYGKATAIFIRLGEYSDAPQRAAEATKLSFNNLQYGDILCFGKYEQDGNISNGKEPIEWIVIAKKTDRVLVLSRYCLETAPFGAKNWGDSSIRKWLNGEFASSAFTAEEFAKIPTEMLSNRRNPEYNTYDDKNTEDKIFLLSTDECSKLLSDEMTIGKRTPYLHNAYIEEYCKPYNRSEPDKNSGAEWWLRSIGYQGSVQTIYTNGKINTSGKDFKSKYINIRPAMWIEISE